MATQRRDDTTEIKHSAASREELAQRGTHLMNVKGDSSKSVGHLAPEASSGFAGPIALLRPRV